MKVWILECAPTSFGFGEDAIEIWGVYASEELAQQEAEDYLITHPIGSTFITEREVEGVDQP